MYVRVKGGQEGVLDESLVDRIVLWLSQDHFWSSIIDIRKLCLVQVVVKCKEGCQEHRIILRFLTNLRRIGEWFWRS